MAHVEFFEEPSVTVDPGGHKEGSANRPGDKVKSVLLCHHLRLFFIPTDRGWSEVMYIYIG